MFGRIGFTFTHNKTLCTFHSFHVFFLIRLRKFTKNTHTHTHTLLVNSSIAKPILACWECGLQLLGDLMNIGFNSITTRIKLSCLTKLVPYNLLLLFRVNPWMKMVYKSNSKCKISPFPTNMETCNLFQVEYLCFKIGLCDLAHTQGKAPSIGNLL
jgi:hypothetical protein